MSFQFRCPKCSSTSFEILKESARAYASEGWDSRVFSCRCGKQMFGEKIGEEYARQTATYVPPSKKERAAKKVQDADSEKRRIASVRRSEAFKRQEQESRQKAETAKQKDHQDWLASLPVSEPSCAWESCSNSPRRRSKYCSRNCSNKNARHRHKQRLST